MNEHDTHDWPDNRNPDDWTDWVLGGISRKHNWVLGGIHHLRRS